MTWFKFTAGLEFVSALTILLSALFVYRFGIDNKVRKAYLHLCIVLSIWVVLSGRWSEAFPSLTYPFIVAALCIGAFIAPFIFRFMCVFPKELAYFKPTHHKSFLGCLYYFHCAHLQYPEPLSLSHPQRVPSSPFIFIPIPSTTPFVFLFLSKF
jgi:hypothetical protein